MPRGGKREGAGRKEGSATRKTSEIAIKAAELGITPLEYMLEVMRAPMPPEIQSAIDAREINAETLDALVGWHQARFEAAKAAAPYMHPRLNAIEVSGKDGGPIPVKFVIEG